MKKMGLVFYQTLLELIGRLNAIYMSSLPSRIRSIHPKIPTIKSIRKHDLVFRFFANSSDALYAHSLSDFAYFEPDTIYLFLGELRAQRTGLFIDVGAHSGLYGVLAMRSGWNTIFCEPNPELAGNIKKNISLNQSPHSKGELLSIAIGDSEEAACLNFGDAKDSAISTLLENPFDSRLKHKMEVRQTTLDSLGLAPSVIKIDVEGYESQVLKGAIKTLRKYKPTIFMEALTPSALKSQSQFLLELGYRPPVRCGHHTHDSRNFIWHPIK